MSAGLSPLAGQLAQAAQLVDVGKLIDAYFAIRPDPQMPAQRVSFGTSGHRGTSFEGSFNQAHVLAISQAICMYRRRRGIDGPLFLGFDSHALSAPAFDSALEVLAANHVDVLIAAGDEFTPTPAISHAILVHNRGRTSGLADGIVITPSHNPPESGGFKYNTPNGGPADSDVTAWIENQANALLLDGLKDVLRMPLVDARRAARTREHDFIGNYVGQLDQIIDFEPIRAAGLRLGVDPLGGAGVHYWARIAEQQRIDLQVVNARVDPQFAFMSLDWDGRIRMDPSSPYAMQPLIALKDRYDIAFACDTDHDRHGIVAPSCGLMPSNHYLVVAIDYLFRHRPQWRSDAGIGKTAVSSSLIDRVAQELGRRLYEVPVGFKWFVDGLQDGSLGFTGEESAGAAFSRRDGSAWTTDKDGMAPALLAAEMTARGGRDPGELYRAIAERLGDPSTRRVDAAATPAQKRKLSRLSPEQLQIGQLCGEAVERVINRAPGNDAPIGGIKVIAPGGWFAARPSGTEDIYKIYAESFRGEAHLADILREAQSVVDAALAGD